MLVANLKLVRRRRRSAAHHCVGSDGRCCACCCAGAAWRDCPVFPASITACRRNILMQTHPAASQRLSQCILQRSFLPWVAQICTSYRRLLLPPMAVDRYAYRSILHHTPFALCLPAAAQAGKRLLCASVQSQAGWTGRPLLREAGHRQATHKQRDSRLFSIHHPGLAWQSGPESSGWPSEPSGSSVNVPMCPRSIGRETEAQATSSVW